MGDRQGYKVIINDREAPVRKTLRKILARTGYDCIENNGTPSMLELVDANRPDLVFMEFLLPGSGSHALAAEIKRCSPGTALVMTTPDTGRDTIVASMQSGAQDYLVKPVIPDDVLAIAERALLKKRLEQRIEVYHRRLDHAAGDKNQLRAQFLASVETLVNELESADKYMHGHSRRVTRCALEIGRELGLTGGQLDDLRWASLFHDVGRLVLDPAVQNKPGTLTPDEYRYVMTHATLGSGIIGPLADRAMVDIISHHHDRFDGSGLDQDVSGKDIPLGARVLALSDAFDAMTSERSFRPAFSPEDGIREIIRCSGTQFDPAVVKAFLLAVGRLFGADNEG